MTTPHSDGAASGEHAAGKRNTAAAGSAIHRWIGGDTARRVILELVIVFVGVSGAFALQRWSELQALHDEREKVLVGLKAELEYFRVFFPGFTARDDIEARQRQIERGSYADFSDWRFLQPQYDYSAIEYALAADADVVDYELNAALASVFVELEKLRHVEDLITQIAMDHQPTPPGNAGDPQVAMARLRNLQGFRLLNDRARDRALILDRVAARSARVLESINREFSPDVRKRLELDLVRQRLAGVSGEALEASIRLVRQYFPDLTDDDVRAALR